MRPIKIITDSAADVPMALAQELDITIISQLFSFDGQNYYKSGVDMTNAEFFSKIKSEKIIPKTSQPPMAEMIRVFQENAECTQIFVTMSKAASGTFQSAHTARDEVLATNREADIHIIDSGSFSFVYGTVVCEAARMASEGAEKDEIISYLENTLPRVNAFFVTDSLEYLIKGGRIKGFQAFLATVLDIKPALTIENGFVVPFEKLRGTKKLHQKLVGLLKKNNIDLNGQKTHIIHACSNAEVDAIRECILEEFKPSSLTSVELGTTIGSHIGPGLMGISFIR